MKRFFIVLLLLGTHYPLAAQELRSGFIVTLKRDTVKGLLMVKPAANKKCLCNVLAGRKVRGSV